MGSVLTNAHNTLQNHQSPAVLQQLVYLAAADGNAPALSMLLDMFQRTQWLVSRLPDLNCVCPGSRDLKVGGPVVPLLFYAVSACPENAQFCNAPALHLSQR